MHGTTVQIASFGRIYDRPQRSNISAGIDVSVHIVSAVAALKRLSLSVADMMAHRAGSSGVPGFYHHHRNACQLGLVLNVLPKLAKAPFSHPASEGFALVMRRRADALQILKSSPFTFLFSNRDNVLGDRVLDEGGRSPFSAAKPFQQFTTVSCAFALNRATHLPSFFSVIRELFGAKFFAVAQRSYRNQAKIHPDKRCHLARLLFRYIRRLQQVKLASFEKQVGFAFDKGKAARIVTGKGHFESATNRLYRDGIAFVGQDAVVIGDAAQRFKDARDFPVQFVGIGDLADTSYKHLRRKVETGLKSMIYFLVNLKLVKRLSLPRCIRNDITGHVRFPDSLKQSLSLLFGRQEFYFQRKFHCGNLLNVLVQETVKANSRSHSSHPRLQAMNGFPASIV
jgi:hypothetical protein